MAGLQVWQSLSEAAGRGHGELELAVLFTDLVGFSAWALKAGDSAALAFLRDVGFVAETAVVEHKRTDRQAARRRADGDVPGSARGGRGGARRAGRGGRDR